MLTKLTALKRGLHNLLYSSRDISTAATLFDERAKTRQRERGYIGAQELSVTGYDRIHEEVAHRLVDRFLVDISPRLFDTIANIGWDLGHVERQLDCNMTMENLRVKHFLQIDASSRLLEASGRIKSSSMNKSLVIAEKEGNLPLEENSVDAILSNLQLHFVNDLLGLLIQSQRALKPEGVFLASLFGGQTLFELRSSLQLAEIEREGGISPHVSPFAG
jgi:NADH dehydrogenase [ubiquinone] 1 alpha subcomplex assembly factor 5